MPRNTLVLHNIVVNDVDLPNAGHITDFGAGNGVEFEVLPGERATFVLVINREPGSTVYLTALANGALVDGVLIPPYANYVANGQGLLAIWLPPQYYANNLNIIAIDENGGSTLSDLTKLDFFLVKLPTTFQ